MTFADRKKPRALTPQRLSRKELLKNAFQGMEDKRCKIGKKELVTQSCPTLASSWSVAHQASLSMGFSRPEYWSGQPFHSPGDLPDPRIKPGSPALQTDSLPSEPPGKPSFRQEFVSPSYLRPELMSSALRVGNGQGGLASCSPWGRKESDMTE